MEAIARCLEASPTFYLVFIRLVLLFGLRRCLQSRCSFATFRSQVHMMSEMDTCSIMSCREMMAFALLARCGRMAALSLRGRQPSTPEAHSEDWNTLVAISPCM